MIDLIKAATIGVSKEQRANAEQQIMKLRQQETEKFFIQFCSIFQNDQIPSNVRQATGTVVNLSILHQINSVPLWDRLQPNAKMNIKDSILSILIDSDRDIRRIAANIVSSICCIQIPRNQWDGIIQKISQNIGNEDLMIKQVSILTLGFICQKLKDKKSFIFNINLQKTILSGIMLGLKENQKQIIETALKALRDGVGSMFELLHNSEIRDYMINQIVEVIRTEQYKNLGLQIITEFAKGSYEHLGSYIGGFITLTEPIITKTKDQDNCIQAMQFWETVATQYKDKLQTDPNCKKYISGPNGQKIVTLLLQNLCAIQQDDETDDSCIVDSASKCLQSIFEEDSNQFQKLALDFTSHTIKHDSWKFRQASIRAFSIFLIGVSQKRKQQLLNASLLELINLLNDSSKGVQYSAIKSINLITEQCADSFLKHAHFLQILKLVVSKLQISQAFLKNACKIIDNLCTECQQTGDDHFSAIADDLIQVLFDTCLRASSSLHTINCCILTIMNLIAVCHNTQVCKKYMKFAIDHFPQVKNLQKQKRQLLFSSFFTLIQTCLISLRKQNLEVEALSTIYQLVTEHYSSISRVDSDGLYVVGALANFFREDTRLIDDFWKYIQHSLSQYTQTHTFKAALSCICDFATNYGMALGQRIPKLTVDLLEYLQKPQVSRQSKLDLIMCIGELYLNCAPSCIPYLEQTMGLIITACQASVTMNETDRNYAQNLRDYIIETLTCILHGLNDQNHMCMELLPHVLSMFQFIKVTCQKSLQPKLQYVKNCVMFMADCSKIYKQHLQQAVRQAWVYDCLELLKKYNKNHNLDRVIDYARSNF